MTKLRPDEHYHQAVELIDDAEALVCAAERALEATSDATQKDIRETELQAMLGLQDQVLESVAPTWR